VTRVGLIARATDRGIAYQTLNVYRGYRVDATLLLRDGNPRWPDRMDRYGNDVIVAKFDGTDVEPGPLGRFLDQVDVVFSVETLYSWKLAAAARNKNVHTIIQGNPELFRQEGSRGAAPMPHEWVWPTTWMLDAIPPGTVLPVPVTGSCPNPWPDPHDERLTFLHVAGHQAIGDRNGTKIFCDAIRYLRAPCRVRIVGQDGELPMPAMMPPHVEVELDAFGYVDHWDLYRGAHVLVMPRRYGGLSLPVLEATESGLVTLMTDCTPNRTWPILPMQCSPGPSQRTPFGPVRTHIVRSRELAFEMDALTLHRDRLDQALAGLRPWLAGNTWEELRPMYDKVFGR
jgi:hypothetical protein